MRVGQIGSLTVYSATAHALPRLTTSARLARIRRVAWLVDSVFHIPGTRFRFGLNSIIGLAPGVGDATLGLISLYIVQQAHAMGLPSHKLARMLGNIALEVSVGAIPVVGDLFDVALKANMRNLRIVEEHFGR